MDASQLLSSTVELGLDLLEKEGSFLPFCKAANTAGDPFVYTPASTSRQGFTDAQAAESVRSQVAADLLQRRLVGVAFCSHQRIRFADSDEKVPAIAVELHYRGQPAAVWYFPYAMEGNTARVLEYFANDLSEDLFAGASNGDG